MKQKHTIISEEERIATLMQHRRLSQILAEIPKEVREEVLQCIVSSKKAYPLPRQTESEAFRQFADAILKHLEAQIDNVLSDL